MQIEEQELTLSPEQLAMWKGEAIGILAQSDVQYPVMPIFPKALIALIEEIERLRVEAEYWRKLKALPVETAVS